MLLSAEVSPANDWEIHVTLGCCAQVRSYEATCSSRTRDVTGLAAECKRPVRIMTKGSFNYGVNHRSSSNRQRHAELCRGRDGFIFTPSPCPITGTGGRGDTLPCPDMMDGYFSSEEKKTQKNTVAAGSETERPTEKRPNCA